MEPAPAANVLIFSPPTQLRTPWSTVMSSRNAEQRAAISINEQVFRYFPMVHSYHESIATPSVRILKAVHSQSHEKRVMSSRPGGNNRQLLYCRR